MRVIVCDDNDLSRNLYYELINGIAEAEQIEVNVKMVSSGEELLQILKKDYRTINLIYLDIYMEGMDGFTVAKESRELGYEGDIVMCSSDKTRVFEAFEVKAINYIVKGATDYSRFREVFLNSAKKEILSKPTVSLIKDRKKIEINSDRIYYLEVYNRKIITHYFDRNELCSLETYGSLKTIEEELEGDGFIRIHNSYLVNGKFIKNILGDCVEMSNGDRLAVSRKHKKNLMEYWTSTES
ncbi:MAG: LytTR family DNA-binding domain-containing protein [Eubacteriaceae bacterium]|nr:LytTR family DNA-binding domain-containing protein [Eubacteriaceae bacterium]